MKRSEPKTFGQIFSENMAKAGMTETYDSQRASYMWTEIVGPTVNRLTTRRYIDRGVLHVYISSASLKSELSFLVEQLRARINAAIGSDVVKSIVIH